MATTYTHDAVDSRELESDPEYAVWLSMGPDDNADAMAAYWRHVDANHERMLASKPAHRRWFHTLYR